ncbi:hypothetical protein C4K30_4283 [Pseudomonas chlororaphis subsp. piscium]|nr:hypothetical protein C4K30_4283 [Pseudomonas chlororaphis subsp. piscium]
MSIAAVHIAPCIGSCGEALRSRLDGKSPNPGLPCTADGSHSEDISQTVTGA